MSAPFFRVEGLTKRFGGLTAVGDVAHPQWRASAVGVYRLWRDLGYAIQAALQKITASGEMQHIFASYGVTYFPPPTP